MRSEQLSPEIRSGATEQRHRKEGALARPSRWTASPAASDRPTLSSVSSTGCDYVAPDFSSASRFAGREPARCASGVGERLMSRDGVSPRIESARPG
jgi:hypothetical protein